MKYVLLACALWSALSLFSCKSKPSAVENVKPVDLAQLDSWWKKVDSLEGKGLITSALELVQKIKREALAAQSSEHLIKAVLYENKYEVQLEEDSAMKALERGENELNGFPEPAKSVMHSLLAQWYDNYLQGHLWELRNTTAYAGPPGPDIRTWGIRHFVDRIQQHYKASVQWPGLREAMVESYAILLTESQKTDELRPTLYDILMHRALDFFMRVETYLTKPASDFILADPIALAPVADFVQASFPTPDSLNQTWQAIHWYQQLLAFRLQDPAHIPALLDADLKRLQFVYQELIAEDKDTLYEKALEGLRIAYTGQPETALVNYYLAARWMEQAANWPAQQASPFRHHYEKAMRLCRQTIETFPEAYGSQLCKNLMQQIGQKSISASVESVVLPGEDILARLEYRNISSTFVKVVRLPESPRRWKGQSWDSEKILDRLNQLPILTSWTQELKESDDYQQHVTEIGLPAMQPGHYAILLSDQKDFNGKSSTTGAMIFTVSELGYWLVDDRGSEPVLAVINRRTGQPMAGVRAEFFSYEYNANQRRQEEVKIGEGISDGGGWVKAPAMDNRNLTVRLTYQADELFPDETYYMYRYSAPSGTRPTTLFFTDRAIYRPGQKVYVKGYAIEFNEKNMPATITNKDLDVTLYDVNGQEVVRKSFRTNEYGTFAGDFDLPSGGLTGQMSLASSVGNIRYFFRVEEYKRPKFEITFDTLKGTARLEEAVVITGISKDYAGSPVSGAKAEYRVERVAYTPWWYRGWYKSWPAEEDRQVLTRGISLTDEQGKVTIPFTAKAKPGADKDLMYRFEITLYVTDLTGESHEATKTLELNRQGYEVHTDVSDRVRRDALKSLSITATNLEGFPVDVSGSLEVAELEGPTMHKRIRLWTTPDVITLSEQEYATRFNHYYIPGKEAMKDWRVRKITGTQNLQVRGSVKEDLSKHFPGPGCYRLTWKWKDASGHEMEIIQFALVYEEGKPLPGQEVIQVNRENKTYEPGEDVHIRLLTGIADAPKVMVIEEHLTSVAARTWQRLPDDAGYSVRLTEADRGGASVSFLTVYDNRYYRQTESIQVPWTNKELKVALKTWRDKLEPGDNETWTINVAGSKGEKVTAEMLLSMYDASLDAFVPHAWSMNLFPVFYSRVQIHGAEATPESYWGLTYHWDPVLQDVPWRQYRDINTYGYYPEGGYHFGRYRARNGGEKMDAVLMQAMPAPAADEEVQSKSKGESAGKPESGATPEAPAAQTSTPPLRSALEETVFFYPQMRTDQDGQLTFQFKMKEGLTRWKFQALAQTTALASGLLEQEVVTQKKLMVFPNAPRFFRTGDTIAFQVKVTNLSDSDQSGIAKLHILDAFTREDVSAQWNLAVSEQTIAIRKGGSVPAYWNLQVPQDWTRPVVYQVFAKTGFYTDGEESFVPVVTNRVLVTETLPLPLKANESRTFIFKSMVENRTATTVDHQFTVEMTTSPAWYAVQALPYLMEYPHECAEQVFSRLYANTLAAHIANRYPVIQQVYNGWRHTNDDALLSNLEKNQDLKSAMLEETPWVRDAMGETQQKKDIAMLFEPNRLQLETKQAIEKLSQMQLANGGFAWFPGGIDNWYITQYIVEGFGHLEKMGVPVEPTPAKEIIERAVPYIDSRMIEWYDDLKKLESAGKINMSDMHIGSLQVHYLYTRSFYPQIQHPARIDDILGYLRSQIEKYWLQQGLYDQGLMALGTYRMWPNDPIAKTILASLRERTIVNEELGRYWKMPAGYFWYESPVELQALMIELCQDMGVPQAEVDELRVWLLKQKQTTRWKSTKATAAAIYALLIHPDAWLASTGIVEVQLGETEVIGKTTDAEAGTGYIRLNWTGHDIQKNWSSIAVRNPNNHIAWGGAYWQYWEAIDQVKSSVDNNPLKVTKTLLLAEHSDRGEQTVLANSRALHVGDKLIVRLTIETDRPMDFVHLKDLRASGFEPLQVLSGYAWSGGLGYYQSTKDLATHFFIDLLPRGKYVIEYPVTVAQSGAYSDGMATAQCMYAPEFGSHSRGSRVSVGLEDDGK